VIRVAAVGDVHVGLDPEPAPWASGLADLSSRADALLLAGDLTRCGTPAEAKVLAGHLSGVAVPVVAVLGNHDHHSGREADLLAVLAAAGVVVLDGEGIVFDVDGGTVGIAGVKGFGGGFAEACVTEFGEDATKAFAREGARDAARLEASLRTIAPADVRIALLHYAPVRDTLRGEHPEVYPFLGSYLLAEAVDAAGADLVVHGHAHRGTERGVTPGGVPVRNVAQPVIRRAYHVFEVAARQARTPGAG
jgi:Icc-related predicted phosphoesterase